MADVEDMIFTKISKALREKFPGIFVTGEYVREPSRFPHVSIVLDDAYADYANQASKTKEDYTVLVFTVNVYSNKQLGKKAQCKEIMSYISSLMNRLNFTRVTQTPVPNLEEATIYRLLAQFKAETDGHLIFRKR